jgi:hypothetical protein
MNRRRIEASEIFSIPESASLDTLMGTYPGSVEASMLDQGGDLYLRVASSRSKDTDEMTEEDIQKKIQEWKSHAKEHATNAGFRKANRGRGPMDPRRFALQLAEAAKLNANRYGSPSLLRLAKKLRWVAGQERGIAVRALAKIAAPIEEEARRRDQVGMPTIQKPLDQTVPPSSEFNEESQLIPGEPIEYGRDESWRSHEASRVAKEKEIDSELLTMARDFLQDYKSRNSLYDDDLLDQLQDPEVFESWIQDLDNKGVNPDPDQLDEAWNQAMSEIAEGAGESLTEGLDEEDLLPVSATRGGETTIQRETAPGGDWFNTVINLHENPVMDRYLRTMKDKREGKTRVSRRIEVEDEIAEAVDQTLDNFAGDMTPGEISADHVQKFVEDKFPGIDWKKVYEAIQKIADPKKRHEDDPKERTNQEASSRGKIHPGGSGKGSEGRRRAEVGFQGKLGLKRYREICACCKGTGEKGERCCGQCHGSGQTDVSAFDENLDRKEKIASKLGTLLVVSVDAGNRVVSAADRQELARVVGTRVASKGAPLILRHSIRLMKVLVESGIPFRTASYRHPRYQR